MMRDEWITQKVHENNYRSVAEIGVESGCTSSYVIRNCDLDVYVMVEPVVRPKLYDMIRDLDIMGPMKDLPSHQCTTRPLILMRMQSVDAVRYIADGSMDLVFIDALHGYRFVMADIRAWCSKVHDEGILCGHDYFPKQPAVKRAVDECFPDVNLYCEEPRSPLGGNHIWWLKINRRNRVW